MPKPKKPPPPPKHGAKVVEATFVMAGPGILAGPLESALAIEQAMLAAVQKAQAEGVTNTDEIRARILAARDAA